MGKNGSKVCKKRVKLCTWFVIRYWKCYIFYQFAKLSSLAVTQNISYALLVYFRSTTIYLHICVYIHYIASCLWEYLCNCVMLFCHLSIIRLILLVELQDTHKYFLSLSRAVYTRFPPKLGILEHVRRQE